MRKILPATLLFALANIANAQSTADTIHALTRFKLDYSGIGLSSAARSGVYGSDAGQRISLSGDDTGAFEIWTWPLKLLSDMRLSFRIEGRVPAIDGTSSAATIVTRPEGVTIVYVHPAFTVRQHVYAAFDEPGAVMLLEVQSERALDIDVQFNPDFDLAWPGHFDAAYATWQSDHRRFLLSQGGQRNYNALIGSPLAINATSVADRDSTPARAQFVVHFDPARAKFDFIPIIIAGAAAPRDSVAAVYARLLTNPQRYWQQNAGHYRNLRTQLTAIETQEPRINKAFQAARIHLDQRLACNSDLGCGLVGPIAARGYSSRDGALSSMALTALGHFDPARQGLALLADYQRADGRIPSLISHAAKRAPWFTDYPQAWDGNHSAHWILACFRYWVGSGDASLVRAKWPQLARAFSEAATQTYHAPDEEVWLDALLGMQRMALIMKDHVTHARAKVLATRLARVIETRTHIEPLDSTAVLGQFRSHRTWAGLTGLRGLAQQQQAHTTSELVLSLVRGMAGWETDVPQRSISFEPHLPAEWSQLELANLRAGKDRMAATITRENGTYTIALRRLTAGAPIAIHIAPALPLGARIERVLVNDEDVPLQIEHTAHDVHPAVEITLVRDAEITIHYEGGVDVLAMPETQSNGARVTDFQHDGREYLVEVSAVGGTAAVVQLRTDSRVRSVQGADSFEQKGDVVTIRATVPSIPGNVHKILRVRTQ